MEVKYQTHFTGVRHPVAILSNFFGDSDDAIWQPEGETENVWLLGIKCPTNQPTLLSPYKMGSCMCIFACVHRCERRHVSIHLYMHVCVLHVCLQVWQGSNKHIETYADINEEKQNPHMSIPNQMPH